MGNHRTIVAEQGSRHATGGRSTCLEWHLLGATVRCAVARPPAKNVASRSISLPSYDGNGAAIGQCIVTDISAGGARLQIPAEVSPRSFSIFLSKHQNGPKRRCMLLWSNGTHVRIRFAPSGA
jgi:hypothetical protein